MVTRLAHPEWVRRLNLFGDVVGDPHRIVSLDPDELLGLARVTTSCDDLGEGDWPGWEETYRRTLTAIDEEADLHVLGRVLTRGETLRVLSTWLRLQPIWTNRPELLAEPINSPLFVLGPPRSGTTILHELLARDPQLRAPLAWEALYPVPGVPAERRRELAECEQELWADIHPEFMTMHELASNLPCECHHLITYDFASPYWSMQNDSASFMEWQLAHRDTIRRGYRLHRRMLQTLQHGAPPRRWLLKSPYHLSMMTALFAEYPDALVVHTHRDPRKFVPSLVSILAALRFMRSDRVDIAALGPAMEVGYQMILGRVIAQREDGSIPNNRIVDAHFVDLMAGPVDALRRIYDQLQLDWPDGHDKTITAYLEAKPKTKHGEHLYTFEDNGLDEASVRTTFADYVKHYDISEE
ncbi:MAG: sulfotransferase family protein [Acidimicrobiia bacterium]